MPDPPLILLVAIPDTARRRYGCFVMARREQGRNLFSTAELVILAVSIVGAVLGVVALVAGWITI